MKVSLAHRVMAGGHLLPEDSVKNKHCLSVSEFVYFQNQRNSRSPNDPGLDLFGTFCGNGKKYDTKTALF